MRTSAFLPSCLLLGTLLACGDMAGGLSSSDSARCAEDPCSPAGLGGQPSTGGSGGGEFNSAGSGGSTSGGQSGSGANDAGTAGSGGATGGATGGSAGSGVGAEAAPVEGACAACYRALCEPTGIPGCACAANLCVAHCSEYASQTCNAGAGGSGNPQGGQSGAGGSSDPATEKDCTDGADDNNNNTTDCEDTSCSEACGNMCLAPPTLESGQDRGGSLQGHTTLFQANCVAVADLGPSLAYQYKAPAAGWLTLELVSQGDLALSAHKGSCQNTGYSYCKNVVGAGGTETLVVEVAQGESWFAVVTAAKKNQPKSFVIRATFEAQVCGDGKVSPGEQCDDGNTLDGDGCSADCKNDSCDNAPALEDKLVTGKGQTPSPTVTNGEFTAGVSLLQASCSKLGVTTPERIHSFRAANPGRLEVSVVPKNPGDDLILSVRSSCAPQGELSCADAAQAGGAERLSLPAEAGQPFYFVVEGADPSAQGGYELRAQTLPVSCGDGLLVRSVEQCDPNAEEKNCADGCTRLPDDGDSSGSAAVAKFPASGSALGRIFPEGDADTFSIEVGPGEKMRLTVTDPTAAPDCADRRLDSQIEVFDAEGLLVAFNDDPSPGASAKGYCSEVLLPSAGTYTVRVRASQRSAPAQVFSYRLLATPL